MRRRASRCSRPSRCSRLPPLAAAQSAEPQTSLPDIEDEVMCIVCGVPLELATEAPQANQERDFIRELIAQGLTKDEIKDRLVAEFGSEVLATPDNSGFDLAAWLVPGAAILAALAASLSGSGAGGRPGLVRRAAARARAVPRNRRRRRWTTRTRSGSDADLARYRL